MQRAHQPQLRLCKAEVLFSRKSGHSRGKPRQQQGSGTLQGSPCPSRFTRQVAVVADGAAHNQPLHVPWRQAGGRRR